MAGFEHAGAEKTSTRQTPSTSSPPIKPASAPSSDAKSMHGPSTRRASAAGRGSAPSCHSYPESCQARPSLDRHRPKIFDKYKVLEVLGEGQFGTVFVVEERYPAKPPAPVENVALKRSVSGAEKASVFACKVVDIRAANSVRDESSKTEESPLEDIMNEIEMMLGLGSDHPNVQDLIDFVIEDDKAYIVSSLCRGGDLAQALDMRGCLCEEDARNVMAGIFNGLSHLHSRGVVHRDIKLENILLTDSKHDMSKVKIIDMGFAKHLAGPEATPHAEALNTVCGTPLYIAPELVRPMVRTRAAHSKALYGTQADMWSCGIILYCLLSGYPPFDPSGFSSMFEMFENIEKAAYNFLDPVWETVSGEARSMIQSLLDPDPTKRLTVEEALRHPWMAGR